MNRFDFDIDFDTIPLAGLRTSEESDFRNGFEGQARAASNGCDRVRVIWNVFGVFDVCRAQIEADLFWKRLLTELDRELLSYGLVPRFIVKSLIY